MVPRLLPTSVDAPAPDAKPLTEAEAGALRGLLRGVVTVGQRRSGWPTSRARR